MPGPRHAPGADATAPLHAAGTAPAQDWPSLSDEAQSALAQDAITRACLIIAEQAELFAAQFAAGRLQDRGGADALRLFAHLLRETNAATLPPAGSA